MTGPTKNPYSRRGFIQSLASASLFLPGALQELMAQTQAEGADASNPLAAKTPMFPAKAKRVIFLYMSGGTSHVDTFDPKPKLIADHGKSYKGDYLSAPRWEFKRYAKCDTEVSSLFPNVGACMDDICVIRSMRNDFPNHVQAVMGLHGGSVVQERPSMGSWVSYGLGTVNQNLPSFMVLAPEMPYGGSLAWNSDFLPACHQGVHVTPGGEPIPNMTRADLEEVQQKELGLINFFNQRYGSTREGDRMLASRIKTFETAHGMQVQAPEAFDLTKETDATLKMYGLERGSTKGFAWQCLMARRLAERGVRFIELVDIGSNQLVNWDAHADMKTHIPLAQNVDQPIAALIKDLKSRGMLDETLVVWSTEFGRRPGDLDPKAKGRTHHSTVYSSWMAGGGIKGGITYGESDEYGYDIAKDQCHVHDFHATMLNQMGIDHKKLTFRHAGRDYRLTDVSGNVIKEILA
jgi:hypothetical protein